MVMETELLFSVFPLAWGSLTSMVSKFLVKVEAIIKKINKRKTISVMEDMLNSGVILFLPLRFIYAGSFKRSKNSKEVDSIW